jgi:hypothetical protein
MVDTQADASIFIFSPDRTVSRLITALSAIVVQLLTSTFHQKWTFAGLVFPNGAPSSTDQYTLTKNGDLWAP